MSKNIEITIPVLNEESTLESQVKLLSVFFKEELSDLGNISLVIADNGSNDKTQEIAERLSHTIPIVKYIRLDKRGVGLALKASWLKSDADIVGYMDLDLATDIKHLRDAFSILLNGEGDIVTGSRLAPGAQVIGRTKLRDFTSHSFNRLIKILFKTKFTDGMCGFKFLNRNKLPILMASGVQSDGWFFATELLVVGEALHLNVVDIPVKWTDDPNSKVKVIKLSIEYMKQMLNLKKRIAGLKSK
ncbi:glycosyltransferase [Vibrio sp.]|jgi:glycosyltransferase involved in cell wall biosynthesis|uniref:glycosyltransferase n=1 Tax=Vibrio sp. TaxID=678 RepID=UPI003AA99CDA